MIGIYTRDHVDRMKATYGQSHSEWLESYLKEIEPKIEENERREKGLKD